METGAARIGILASGDGWHLRALAAALVRLGCEPVLLDAKGLSGLVAERAAIRASGHDLERLDALLVRLIPPGSLDQIVFRIDCLHLLADGGLAVVNSPRAL